MKQQVLHHRRRSQLCFVSWSAFNWCSVEKDQCTCGASPCHWRSLAWLASTCPVTTVSGAPGKGAGASSGISEVMSGWRFVQSCCMKGTLEKSGGIGSNSILCFEWCLRQPNNQHLADFNLFWGQKIGFINLRMILGDHRGSIVF